VKNLVSTCDPDELSLADVDGADAEDADDDEPEDCEPPNRT